MSSSFAPPVSMLEQALVKGIRDRKLKTEDSEDPR